MPSPVASTGLVVTAVHLAAAPAGENDVRGLDELQLTVRVERHDAGAAPALEHEIEGKPALERGGGAVAHGFDKGALDLGTCGGAPRVENTRRRVAAFPRPRQSPARAPVEHGSQRDELVHALGPFVHEHPHRRLIAQSHAGAKSVRQVEIGRVLVAGQHRRDAALSPTRRRLLQLALGEDPDPGASKLGESHGGGKAGHPAPDHQHVEPLEPTHLHVQPHQTRRDGARVMTAPPSCRSGGPTRAEPRRETGARRKAMPVIRA